MSIESQPDIAILTDMLKAAQQNNETLTEVKNSFQKQLNLLRSSNRCKNNIQRISDMVERLKNAFGDITLSEVQENLVKLKKGELCMK